MTSFGRIPRLKHREQNLKQNKTDKTKILMSFIIVKDTQWGCLENIYLTFFS